MIKKTVLSGVQPTGDLHLGNYLGAIKNFAIMQNEHNRSFYINTQRGKCLVSGVFWRTRSNSGEKKENTTWDWVVPSSV